MEDQYICTVIEPSYVCKLRFSPNSRYQLEYPIFVKRVKVHSNISQVIRSLQVVHIYLTSTISVHVALVRESHRSLMRDKVTGSINL